MNFFELCEGFHKCVKGWREGKETETILVSGKPTLVYLGHKDKRQKSFDFGPSDTLEGLCQDRDTMKG